MPPLPSKVGALPIVEKNQAAPHYWSPTWGYYDLRKQWNHLVVGARVSSPGNVISAKYTETSKIHGAAAHTPPWPRLYLVLIFL